MSCDSELVLQPHVGYVYCSSLMFYAVIGCFVHLKVFLGLFVIGCPKLVHSGRFCFVGFFTVYGTVVLWRKYDQSPRRKWLVGLKRRNCGKGTLCWM